MNDFVGEIEQELIDATNFKPERNYRDKQKYLEALLRACANLDDDQFDHLSDLAADWCNEAAEANKNGFPLPEFPNGGAHGSNSTKPVEAPREAEMALTGSESPDEPHRHEDEPPVQKKKKGGRPKGSKTKKAMAPVKVTVAKPKQKAKPRPTANENIARRAAMGVNLWGITLGCKADIACKLAAQEGGTSMKEVREATGGNKYNLFNRLQKNGYDIKVTNGRIYLAKPVLQQAAPVEDAPATE